MQTRRLREKSLHPTPAKLLRDLHQQETGRPFVLFVVRLQKNGYPLSFVYYGQFFFIFSVIFSYCLFFSCLSFLCREKVTRIRISSERSTEGAESTSQQSHVMPVPIGLLLDVMMYCRVSFPTTLDLSPCLVSPSISPTPSPWAAAVTVCC